MKMEIKEMRFPRLALGAIVLTAAMGYSMDASAFGGGDASPSESQEGKHHDAEDAAVLRTSVSATIGVISKAARGAVGKKGGGSVRADLSFSKSGVASGDGSLDLAAWTNYDYLGARSLLGGASDNSMHTISVGVDKKITNNPAVGVAFSYQQLDENFDSGSRFDTDSWTIAPYAAYMVNDNIMVDAVLGYTGIREAQTVFAFDTSRVMAATNLTVFKSDPVWDISGNVGYLFTRDVVDAYGPNSEDTISFAQMTIGGEVGYFMDGVEPYASVTYEKDLVYQADAQFYDEEGVAVGVGARVDISSGLMGEVRGSKMHGRDFYDHYTFTANLRMNF